MVWQRGDVVLDLYEVLGVVRGGGTRLIPFTWGLDHAHRNGLIHQDVKPAHLMLAGDGTTNSRTERECCHDSFLFRLELPAAHLDVRAR
jgi:serine/threonine protein kinase